MWIIVSHVVGSAKERAVHNLGDYGCSSARDPVRETHGQNEAVVRGNGTSSGPEGAWELEKPLPLNVTVTAHGHEPVAVIHLVQDGGWYRVAKRARPVWPELQGKVLKSELGVGFQHPCSHHILLRLTKGITIPVVYASRSEPRPGRGLYGGNHPAVHLHHPGMGRAGSAEIKGCLTEK